MVDLEPIEVGQAPVPVVRVPLHPPHFVLLPGDVPERTSARIARELAEVSVVLVQRLLADDDVEPARERREHELRRPRLTQLELDAVWIEHRDLAHRGEQRGPRHDDTLRWPRDPGERRLHVLGGELGAVVELHAAAEVKGVAPAVGRDVPLPREIRDDRLPVARVTSDEVVVHRPLRGEVGDRA